jgi:hypothetical protein
MRWMYADHGLKRSAVARLFEVSFPPVAKIVAGAHWSCSLSPPEDAVGGFRTDRHAR